LAGKLQSFWEHIKGIFSNNPADPSKSVPNNIAPPPPPPGMMQGAPSMAVPGYHPTAYVEGEGGEDTKLLDAIGKILVRSYEAQLAMRADLDTLAGSGGSPAQASLGPSAGGTLNAFGGTATAMPTDEAVQSATSATSAAMRSAAGVAQHAPPASLGGSASRLASLPPAGMPLPSGATGDALSIAMGHLGQTERGDTGKLSSFFAGAGLHLNPAFTAWCAAFVNSSLAAAGIKGTGSLAADSFKKWGASVATDALQAGDILVKNQHSRFGHVGIFDGNRRGNMLEMIAGNSHDRVEREWVPASNYLGRRAIHYKDSDKEHVQVHSELKIDGRKFADAVSKHTTKKFAHSTQAAFADGRRGYWDPGMQYTST
jgi:hypothetical protein